MQGLDGVYLDLHGAAVAENADDSEGELIARIRAVVGPKLPIVASLDLHANVTERMLQLSDGLVAYRTYPHIDMAETGARTAFLLAQRLDYETAPYRLEEFNALSRQWNSSAPSINLLKLVLVF